MKDFLKSLVYLTALATIGWSFFYVVPFFGPATTRNRYAEHDSVRSLTPNLPFAFVDTVEFKRIIWLGAISNPSGVPPSGTAWMWYQASPLGLYIRYPGAGGTHNVDSAGGLSSHAVLSSTHSDASAGTVVRGDIITGQGGSPTWTRKALGSSGAVLRSDGTDLLYSTFTIPNTFAQGDVLYCSATNVLTALTKNTTASRYLANTGTNNNPNWDMVNLSNGIQGKLSIQNINMSGSPSSTTFLAGDSTWRAASLEQTKLIDASNWSVADSAVMIRFPAGYTQIDSIGGIKTGSVAMSFMLRKISATGTALPLFSTAWALANTWTTVPSIINNTISTGDVVWFEITTIGGIVPYHAVVIYYR